MSAVNFNYEKAFSRNLGWVTADEQKIISKVKVGIVGLGGVGGQYAEILTRLGVTQFSLCDQDEFSMENTNRQNGCQVENYGRKKVDVIKERILSINPQAHVKVRNTYLQSQDVLEFCQDIDVYFDSIDFFELKIREELFECMRTLKRPALTAAPIGAGCSALLFDQGSMSFKDYFGLHSKQNETHKNILFLIGVAPSLQHAKYLVDRQFSDFKNRKAPSLPLGVYACASTAATIFLKLILNRGKILRAPWSIHYDPYNISLKKTYLWGGYRNPLQKIKFHLVKYMLKL